MHTTLINDAEPEGDVKRGRYFKWIHFWLSLYLPCLVWRGPPGDLWFSTAGLFLTGRDNVIEDAENMLSMEVDGWLITKVDL